MSHYHPPNSPKRQSGKKFYHQGFFKPTNVLKYIGDPTKIVYRSKWELHFMIYCDQKDIIAKWSCEHIAIPYQDKNGKIHRYYPDFYIERIDPNDPDNYIRAIVEIKPGNEIQPDFVNPDGSIKPPEIYLKKITAKSLESYEYKLKTYQKNLYKWTKAKIWCEQRHLNFHLMNETYMKQKGIM